MQNRSLFFGDNLEVLRDKFPGEQGYFDLIYLDPPFNSNRNYNVIFKEGLVESSAQAHAFEDSWHWTSETKAQFDNLTANSNPEISDLMQSLAKVVGQNDVLAYLTMMTTRLIELHRVLKPTGSLYLHCDITASHYLKIILDIIFNKKNFINEIVWYYPNKLPDKRKRLFTKSHDSLLFYAKDREKLIFNVQEELRDKPVVDRLIKKVNGKKVSIKGKDGKNIYVTYTHRTVDSVWRIASLASNTKERLNYQTQKPEKLLERIILASSNEGDWVLDPFCGCGTTVAVAERLNRKWVGIDISTLSIEIMQNRLTGHFPKLKDLIHVDGLPKDISGAKALAESDRWNFEYWVLGLIGAYPAPGKTKANMKGADRGIDGIVRLATGKDGESIESVLVQVKSGKVQRNDISTLIGDVARERALGGVFISLEAPTRPMIEETVEPGTVKTVFGEFPKIQIITVAELMDGKKLNLPGLQPRFKQVSQSQLDQKALL